MRKEPKAQYPSPNPKTLRVKLINCKPDIQLTKCSKICLLRLAAFAVFCFYTEKYFQAIKELKSQITIRFPNYLQAESILLPTSINQLPKWIFRKPMPPKTSKCSVFFVSFFKIQLQNYEYFFSFNLKFIRNIAELFLTTLLHITFIGCFHFRIVRINPYVHYNTFL